MAFSFLTGKRRSAKPDGVNQKQNGNVELDFGDGVNTANECDLPSQPYDAVETEADGIQTSTHDAAHFDKIARRTAEYVDRWSAEAEFIERNPPAALPDFDPQEVQIAKDPLGRGEFGIVYAVTALRAPNDPCHPSRETCHRQQSDSGATMESSNSSSDAILDDGNFTIRIPTSVRVTQVLDSPGVRRRKSSTGSMNMLAAVTDALSVATHNTAKSDSQHQHAQRQQHEPKAFSSSVSASPSTVKGCGEDAGARKEKPVYSHSASSLKSRKTRRQALPATSSKKKHRVVLSNTSVVVTGHGHKEDEDMNDTDNSTLSTTDGEDAFFDDHEDAFFDDHDSKEEVEDGECLVDPLVDGEVDFLRSHMCSHVMRHGRARYAVKRLGGHNCGLDAAVDLACEARFLASLRHPNVVRLRATIGKPGDFDFGLVMDRLDMTLRQKMQQWRDEESVHWRRRKRHHHDAATHDLLADKLLAVYDVARAMRYLHNQMIIFRDLKPENVGVDLRGEMKLFDFGLAKELKARDLVQAPDDFNLTGLTGSRRYMSPEVASCRTYGLKADVYSFAILMWEVLACPGGWNRSSTMAFPRMSIDAHYERVVVGGERPPLHRVRPKSLRGLVDRSWSATPSQRPSFRSLCDELRQHVGGMATTTDRTAYLSGLSVRSMNE